MIPLLIIIFLSKYHGLSYGIIKSSPAQTTGLISRVDQPEGFQAQKNVFYTYTTLDNESHEGNYQYPNRLEERFFEAGQSLDITYSQLKPEFNYPTDQIENQDINFYLLSGSFIGILILALVVASSVASIFNHRNEDRHY